MLKKTKLEWITVLTYFLSRLVSFIPLVVIVAMISFFLINLAPGDPAAIILGHEASAIERQVLIERMGLDRPIIVQFGSWFFRAIKGDLGQSYFWEHSVAYLITSRVKITFQIAFVALLIALAIGIPGGLMAAIKRETFLDFLFRGFSFLGFSIPSFWLGLNLIYLFAVVLRILPSGGFTRIEVDFWQSMKSTILPALSLGLVQSAFITRMVRSTMLEVIQEDYIRTARAKGVAERVVIFKHAMRNTMLPTITTVGIIFGMMLGGSVIIEEVFSIPGLGKLVITSIFRRDYPLLQGIILFYALIYLVVNFVVDITYALFDPRITYGGKK